jgi:hypothetical protein
MTYVAELTEALRSVVCGWKLKRERGLVCHVFDNSFAFHHFSRMAISVSASRCTERAGSRDRSLHSQRGEGRTAFCLLLLQFVTDAVGLTIHGGQEAVGSISRWLCHYHGIHHGFEPVYGK